VVGDGEDVAVGVEVGDVAVGVEVGDVAVGVEVGVVVGCEDPPGCAVRRIAATMATTTTAAIMTHIVVFFELMGGRWRYCKNLFAMFNGGRIDATRHSLKRNSYETPIFLPLCCGEKLIKPRLPCLPKKVAASFALFIGIRQTIKNDAEARRSSSRRRSGGFGAGGHHCGQEFRPRVYGSPGNGVIM
jgi:hypothetical protein